MLARTAADLVAEAKARIENLFPVAVAADREQGDVLLVDAREREERAQDGTIHGAILAPHGMLDVLADPMSAYYVSKFDPGRLSGSHRMPLEGGAVWRPAEESDVTRFRPRSRIPREAARRVYLSQPISVRTLVSASIASLIS